MICPKLLESDVCLFHGNSRETLEHLQEVLEQDQSIDTPTHNLQDSKGLSLTLPDTRGHLQKCEGLNGSEPGPIHSGASMGRTCSIMSHGCLIKLGSGELETRSCIQLFVMFPGPFLSSFGGVPGHSALHEGTI